MKALKPFIDANQKNIKRGDVIKKSDYRKEVLSVMIERGMVANELKPTKNKMAKPKTTKVKK